MWQGRSAEMLVQGYVRANSDGQLTVGCYLYDVALKQQLAKAGWVVPPGGRVRLSADSTCFPAITCH